MGFGRKSPGISWRAIVGHGLSFWGSDVFDDHGLVNRLTRLFICHLTFQAGGHIGDEGLL